MRQSGLLSLLIPRELGGWGASWPEITAVVRRLAQVDGSVAHVFGFQHLLLRAGRSAAERGRTLPDYQAKFARRPSSRNPFKLDWSARRERKADLERVYERFPRLRAKRKLAAGYTSGGEQQMIALGRALMGRPRLILLDEPSMGLAPQVVAEIFEIIRELNRAEGVSCGLGRPHPLPQAQRGSSARRCSDVDKSLNARLRANN